MMPNASSLRSAMWALLARPVAGDVAVLKGLTWLRVGVTLVLAGMFALSVASAWHFLCPSCTDQKAFIPKYLQWLRNFSLSLFPPMLALTVADNLRLTTFGRTATLVMGFVVGTLVAWLFQLVVDFGNPLALTYDNVLGSIPNGLPITTGLIALVYFKRRRDLEIAAALHEAGLARVDLQKRTLESNLQAMQARIEPRFLVSTLRTVGALYEADAIAADQMLDHLITYLRAALPQMRSTTSTVGVELDLVRAYLGIQRIWASGRLDFEIDAPEELLDSPFPPMVLLPLVEEALSRGGGGEAELRIAVGVDDDKLKITLADLGLPEHTQGALDGVRARLTALYGNNATLVLRRRERGATETEMGIPYEHAETTDV
jgi:LytS/YehU family sensor histidine kinase